MKIVIFIAGLYNIGLAIFHIGFWRLFKWKKDLNHLRFENRAIMQILNIQIIFFFIMVAYICIEFNDELLTTKLGRAFLTGNAIFWLIRTIQQFIFLRANHYLIHILTLVFILGTILFSFPVLSYWF
ncbi:MAG: hypothetical protein SFU98_19030 [Leptospiraceae bacterium]|nr:hypothetical protein [Leptospiraceae bacterium]